MTRRKSPTAVCRRKEAPARLSAVDSTHLIRDQYLLEPFRQLSMRERLELYLQAEHPTELHKGYIDRLLRRLLAGEDPRKVFRLNAGRKGQKVASPEVILAAALELARLRGDGHAKSAALPVVAERYGVGERTLERWAERADISQDQLDAYRSALRHHKLI